ncbi:DUF5677 domain-containing protein [Clostridioides difficile]
MNKIKLIRDIMPSVEENLIKNRSTHVIFSEYEYLREVMTLYAKQHNLIESTILLLDNNMCEEAYILARSVLNNYFLIEYLLNDNEDKSRLKEYQIQPLLAERKYWKKVKDILNRNLMKKFHEEGKLLDINENSINRTIGQIEANIQNENFRPNKRLLNITDLARDIGGVGIELYLAYYTHASKYEHSDISSLDIYREEVNVDNVSNKQAFIMTTDRTDESLRERIESIITTSYVESFRRILEEISVKNSHLLINFKEEKLLEISLAIIHNFG